MNSFKISLHLGARQSVRREGRNNHDGNVEPQRLEQEESA